MRATAVQAPTRGQSDPLARAMFAGFLACDRSGGQRNAAAVAKTRWPEDRITRAAVEPASTTNPEWAAVLAPAIVAEFFSNLPQSAASRLIAQGPRITLAGRATVSFPRATSAPAYWPWIGEGLAIPVASFAIGSATLGPARKFAIITVASQQLFDMSNTEAAFGLMLREVAGKTLDRAMFSVDGATAERPAGLLAGVTALTPAAAGAGAVQADVAALVGAVGAAGGDPSGITLVAASAQAATIMVGLPDLRVPVWGSAVLAPGVVIAIDASAFASAFSGAPHIESSTEAAVHLETEPLPIGTPGTPPTIASPVVSAFQSGLVVTRLITDVGWTMRAPGLVQHIVAANW